MFSKFIMLLILSREIYTQEEDENAQTCITNLQVVNDWAYSDQEEWEKKYVTCKGGFQSPINLVTNDLSLRRNKIKFEYEINNGGWNATLNKNFQKTIQIVSNHSAIQIFDVYDKLRRYQANDIQFRFPSEHQLNGFNFDGEIQIQYIVDPLYCKGNTNQIAFLSIFLIEDNVPDDPFFTSILSSDNSIKNFDFRENLTQFLSSFTSSYIQYNGTQTFPPCQKAYWNILLLPKRINTQQLGALSWMLKGNVRKIQTNTPFLEKGTFVYYVDDFTVGELNNDGVWAAVWAASIAPCFFLLLIVLIYGLYKLTAPPPPKNTIAKSSNEPAQEEFIELQAAKETELRHDPKNDHSKN